MSKASRRIVLEQINAERISQIEKWGPQDHPHVSPESRHFPAAVRLATERMQEKKIQVDLQAKNGNSNFLDILREEIEEAAVEAFQGNTPELRTELIQAAAVIVQWIEAIDAREANEWREHEITVEFEPEAGGWDYQEVDELGRVQ